MDYGIWATGTWEHGTWDTGDGNTGHGMVYEGHGTGIDLHWVGVFLYFLFVFLLPCQFALSQVFSDLNSNSSFLHISIPFRISGFFVLEGIDEIA